MRAWLWLAAGLAWAGAARAQPSADTLRISWRDAIPVVDPYYNTQRTGLVLAHQVWDTLIQRDPETFQLKPLLATSWRFADDTTIEFELRAGVTFHDGSPFTADDVVYTVNTVLADPRVAVPSNYAFLDRAERIDDRHVRLKLKRVFPAALEYIAMVLPIWPRAYRERVGPAAYAQAPVGTGPYRVTRVDGTSQINLERHDGYFDGPKGHPAIRRVVIHEVADASAEVDDLLAGRADWIWMFDPERSDALSRAPGVQVMRQESMRFGYASLDAAGRTGADNPLTRLKVRRAIFHAIDRAALARTVPGGARVLDAPCFPTQFGCDQASAEHYDYDPARARALLAEAGFPDGFDTEVVSYVVPAYGAAIQGYLAAVGIRAKLAQEQVGPAVKRSVEGRNPIDLGSWGSYSINDVSAVLPVFFGGGAQDYARDPEVIRLVTAAGSTIDPDQRRRAYSAAIRRITTQALWLPLHTFVTSYAISRQLQFKPFPDELPRFYLTSWK